jgi:hypothetical protein
LTFSLCEIRSPVLRLRENADVIGGQRVEKSASRTDPQKAVTAIMLVCLGV